jgi:hypothetical protein
MMINWPTDKAVRCAAQELDVYDDIYAEEKARAVLIAAGLPELFYKKLQEINDAIDIWDKFRQDNNLDNMVGFEECCETLNKLRTIERD